MSYAGSKATSGQHVLKAVTYQNSLVSRLDARTVELKDTAGTTVTKQQNYG